MESQRMTRHIRGEFYRASEASGFYVAKVASLRAASFASLVGYFSYAL